MTEPQRSLPCGHPAALLLELAADGAHEPSDPAEAAHLASCPHCRAELAALRGRWASVRLAAARPVRVPPGLVDRTLSSVRAVRGGVVGRHTDMAQAGGLVRITESTVLVLARRLARDVIEALPGVRLRDLSGGVDGLRVRLAVPYGMVLADAAQRVRRDLRRELDLVLGAATPPVDVLVEDVLAPGPNR
ncbi:MAG: anti-sigma factor family protein [Pseudonocardiaceae bacterium]